jgi:hypothetical protein
MKSLKVLICVVAVLSACSNPEPKATVAPTDTEKAVVGGDKDAHGCIGSAGYQWSELRGECVRIFEVGVPFAAYGSNKDETLAAYVIYGKDEETAEAFIPQLDHSVLLERSEVKAGNLETVLYENKLERLRIVNIKNQNFIQLNADIIFMKTSNDRTKE